jgi:hypothetical protein
MYGQLSALWSTNTSRGCPVPAGLQECVSLQIMHTNFHNSFPLRSGYIAIPLPRRCQTLNKLLGLVKQTHQSCRSRGGPAFSKTRERMESPVQMQKNRSSFVPTQRRRANCKRGLGNSSRGNISNDARGAHLCAAAVAGLLHRTVSLAFYVQRRKSART